MKIPERAISYLNDTLHDRWSFPHVINLIKEELSLNNEDSFSVLDRILKKDFKETAKSNEWKTKWKSLIKQYEKTKETRNESNKPAYNLNVNTANNMFNNYQGSQTIHSTFTEDSSSVSKMPISESQPSTTTPDINDTDDTSDALSADEVEDDNATINAGLFKKESCRKLLLS
ncbi:unnamed protein product [Mucor fragilis]